MLADLFVINIVKNVLKVNFPTCFTSEVNERVTTAVLVGAILGQIGFGFFADFLGRRNGLIVTCMLLIAGAILSAGAYTGADISALFWLMTISRFILGVGIGGEYPVAAATASESSEETDPRRRGRNVLLVFSMQGVGAILADVVVLILLAIFGFASIHPSAHSLADNLTVGNLSTLSTGMIVSSCNASSADPLIASHAEAVWRLAFGLGAIPPLLIIFQRIRLKETAKFSKAGRVQKSKIRWGRFLRKYWVSLLGAGGGWLLWDVVFYGNSLFMSEILATLGVGEEDIFMNTVFSTCVALVALPGYFTAAFTVDHIGRKKLQIIGFGIITVLFLIVGIFFEFFRGQNALFMVTYAVIYFFFQFGPNSTTFLIPSEVFPTAVRARAHGLCAALGKIGAVIGKRNPRNAHGLFDFSDNLFVGSSSFAAMKGEGTEEHANVIFIVCGAVSLAGLLLTVLAVKDKTGESLDKEDEEFRTECVEHSSDNAHLEVEMDEDIFTARNVL